MTDSLEYHLTTEDKVLFLHIPKTAGISFITILEQYFHQSQIYMPYNWFEISKPSISSFGSYRLFRGHFYYDLIKKLLNQSPVSLTLLREPVERFISEYAHLQRLESQSNPYDRWYERVKNLDLNEFVDESHHRLHPLYSDRQVDMIAAEINLPDLSQPDSVFTALHSRTHNTDANRAQSLLAQFQFFGVVERLPESLMLLAYTFGWPLSRNLPIKNTAPQRLRRDAIAPNTLTKLEQLNANDLSLYDFGLKLFEQRLSHMKHDLLERYGQRQHARLSESLPFETIYDLLESHYCQRFAEYFTPQRFFALQMQEAIFGQNWLEVESDDRQGLYRWTGTNTLTTLDLPIQADEDKKLVLRVWNSPTPEILDSSTIRVNDFPIVFDRYTDELGAYIFEGYIPRSSISNGLPFLRLQLRVTKTGVPAQIDPQQSDSRQLGVAVNWIKIVPWSITPLKTSTQSSEGETTPFTIRSATPNPKHQPPVTAMTSLKNPIGQSVVTPLETMSPSSLENTPDKSPVAPTPAQVAIKSEGYSMPVPNERVIEIPWALANLPQRGLILDIGSCDAVYLTSICQPGRQLHCLDPRPCSNAMPSEVVFHHQDLIGNSLPRAYYDAVLVLSTIEHIGLPCYGQQPFAHGDQLALAEVRDLLKPNGVALFTMPAGQSKITTWYRQYSPADLTRLFSDWQTEITYWADDGQRYRPIPSAEVVGYDYRDRNAEESGASALACVLARPV